jgi:RNA polymerase sigma-70 factor (ECF subfamily)
MSDGGHESAAPDLETTSALFQRIRLGDEQARQRLFARFLPVVTRWAHGRLPLYARGLADTDDLVQVTLTRALNRMDAFEPRGEGAFLAYLRRILLNSVREELRRSRAKPSSASEGVETVDPGPSVVEQLVARETLARYEAALGALPADVQEAVILRIEFDYGYEQIAEALGRPSANAARMTVSRALLKLAEAMHERR